MQECVPPSIFFALRGSAFCIARYIALFVLDISLVFCTIAIGQTAPAPVPAQPPPFSPPLPHVNGPLGDISRMPGDGNGAYKTHVYRDLFAELGHPPAESHAKIEKAFQQLFHGDGQQERIYFETGANANGALAYITDWANNDARSEGMSYGMIARPLPATYRRTAHLGSYRVQPSCTKVTFQPDK